MMIVLLVSLSQKEKFFEVCFDQLKLKEIFAKVFLQ